MATMRAGATVGTFVVLLFAVGCGGSAKRADLEPKPMPEGGTFTGVWNSPQYGEMHMVQEGKHVIGEYQKDNRQGRIQGTVNGNVLRFRWTEKREMVQGNPTVTRGRGYFQYEIGEDGRHYAIGEWGIDDSETGGGPWRAYKLEGRRAELSTSGGETAQQQSQSGSGSMGAGGQGATSATSSSASSSSSSSDQQEEYDWDDQPDTGGDSSEPQPEDDALEGLDEF